MPLVKRNNSRFWYAQFQIEGRTFVKSTKTTDRKTALKIETKLRSDAHAGLLLKQRKKTTFRVALDRYIEARKTTASYDNLLSRRKVILKVISSSTPLHDVDTGKVEQLKQYLVDQGYLPQTIKHYINTVMGTIKMARKHGYHVADVEVPSIKLPTHKCRFLSTEEETRLLSELAPDASKTRYRPCSNYSRTQLQNYQDNYDLVVLLLDTGARCSEIRTLQWSQVDLKSRTINLWRSKVENESVLFMTDRVHQVLQRRLNAVVATQNEKCSSKPRYVFEDDCGQPKSYRNRSIRTAFDRAGLHDCSLHTLHHTHASRLVQMGMSIYEVQKVLGHNDIRTTMRYAHLEQVDVHTRARDLINGLNGSDDNNKIEKSAADEQSEIA